MSSWLELKDRGVVVTGAVSGIGKSVSTAFAEAGARVALADINSEAGEKTISGLAGGAERHVFVETDVSSRESVENMINTAADNFGRIDVLVNNAGINIPRLLVDPAGKEEMTEDVWDKVVDVNMKGVFLCAQSAARLMISDGSGGVIINMASESGSEGSEGQSVYAATKAAIYNLTRSWAKELGGSGVRVVGVAPGILEETALRSESYERSLAYTRGISVEELRSKYEKASIPLGRPGKLSEVADLVCFLASRRAGYIHGTTVNISGGKSRA